MAFKSSYREISLPNLVSSTLLGILYQRDHGNCWFTPRILTDSMPRALVDSSKRKHAGISDQRPGDGNSLLQVLASVNHLRFNGSEKD